MPDDSTIARRLAELAVSYGANVQPGQIVSVTTDVGKERLTREVARAAYERGARWVDVLVFDTWIKRERILNAPPETLSDVPPWMLERLEWLSAEHAARIILRGPHAPHALDGLDPKLAGRDLLPYLPLVMEVVNRATTNWTVVPAPTTGWAEVVYPGLPGNEALARLWCDVAHICRLDEDDPAAAWEARFETLRSAAERLTARRFDSLRLHGPGTDLTVGLLASSRWLAAGFRTVDGVDHYPNLPSEEIFTTPDPERVEGHVTASRPLELYGSLIDGIHVAFRNGRVTRIDAASGADALRSAVAKEGGDRLGEIALVDRSGRIGRLGTVFRETLIDENAASHIALGSGYTLAVEDEAERARVNRSTIHVDVMVGSPELDVDGITRDGETVPVLRGGDWQI